MSLPRRRKEPEGSVKPRAFYRVIPYKVRVARAE